MREKKKKVIMISPSFSFPLEDCPQLEGWGLRQSSGMHGLPGDGVALRECFFIRANKLGDAGYDSGGDELRNRDKSSDGWAGRLSFHTVYIRSSSYSPGIRIGSFAHHGFIDRDFSWVSLPWELGVRSSERERESHSKCIPPNFFYPSFLLQFKIYTKLLYIIDQGYEA